MDPRRHTGGATHRYGLVLLGTGVVVIAILVLPDDDVGRGIGLVLQALLLTMVTGAARDARSRAITATAAAAGVFGAVSALGITVPSWLVLGLSGAMAAIMIWTVARGLVTLIGDAGVTVQAVAGGLALYLLVGLMFSYVVGALANAGSGPFFAQGTDGTSGIRIYFSFAALTTTGFGDFTPRTDVGRSVTVLETLVGQIYLVVVVALLVSNLRRRGD